MKRIFVFIFVVMLLLSGVAAVWQRKATPASERMSGNHLVWVTDDNPARREQIRLFEQLNPGVTVDIDPGNAGIQKIIVQAKAGVGPDLFDCLGADQIYAFAKSKIAWDVTDAMKADGFDVAKMIWPLAAQCCIVDGRVYAFPCNVSSSGIWLNRDSFARAGIPVPAPNSPAMTWEQFVPILEKLTTREPATGQVKQWGYLPSYDFVTLSVFMEQWGGHFYTPDGTKCIIDSPEAIAGAQFFHDLIYKYHVAPTPSQASAIATTGGWGGEISLFDNQLSATAAGSRYEMILMRTVPGLNFAPMLYPHHAGGPLVYYGVSRTTCINAQDPPARRLLALKFLEYLAGKPYNQLLNQQGDGLSGVVKYAGLLAPTSAPEENTLAWSRSTPYATALQTSPYVDQGTADDIIRKQSDLIMANQKPVAQALHDAAAQVNAAMAITLSRDPVLNRQYKAALDAESRRS